MTTPDEQLRLFGVAGRLAADRWYAKDEAMDCLMACLREVGLDPEAMPTQWSERLIDAFFSGYEAVLLRLPNDDGGDNMTAVS